MRRSGVAGLELARYKPLRHWQPQIGDFIIWAGWFSTSYGIVSGLERSSLLVVFDGLPSLLFTLTGDEQSGKTEKVELERVRTARPGAFTVMQHEGNNVVWYI